MFRSPIAILTFFILTSAGAQQPPQCPWPWLGADGQPGCELIPFAAQVSYPYQTLLETEGTTGIFGKLLYSNFFSDPSEFPEYLKEKVWSATGGRPRVHQVTAGIRAGFLRESPSRPYRGNILYFPGLGDSMVNHAPLFTRLTQEGFRVIAFDYMGQGGSRGHMNNTRMKDIIRLGEIVYARLARDKERAPRIAMGWSTGGLAAYMLAQENKSHGVILIAPGLVPNSLVGDLFNLQFKMLITKSTLTSERYEAGRYDPHIEPIRPSSPMDVPDFGVDLQLTALSLKQKPLALQRPGIVFTGGDDGYVDGPGTAEFLRLNAPHYAQVFFEKARHEIDNEVPEIGSRLRAAILHFLAVNFPAQNF